ncbi:response regulator [Occallatibacter savannae]|uniref:response regulator n=1 Tax=Occallatibacter savannae TaxID=1002691 RepID=UPI000D696947|nr:response regulator [Occallatibacter savannae]
MARVLLVEDNELNRDMLSRRLTKCGWQVTCAEDGLQGVRLAEQYRPDLILMDLSLPLLSGWNAARQIKADANLRSIPIIALSAHAMRDDRASALDAGCDEFETKPIEFERLIHKMSSLTVGEPPR